MAQRPPTTAQDATRLDLQEFREAIERAVEVIAKPIPNGQRRHFEASFYLTFQEDQLTVRCRMRPTIISRARIELLHAIDFTESRRIATKLLLTYWSNNKSWLRKSGIQQLELRCDARVMKHTSRAPQAA
ncbi:MAG: hypothetical protein ACQETX_11545 [Pseudomonadota bacterium]